MKPREFWISGINFDEIWPIENNKVITGFITPSHPGDEERPRKESILVREIVPIDWEKVWKEYEKEKWNAFGLALKTGQEYQPVDKSKIQQIVEIQLRGEE